MDRNRYTANVEPESVNISFPVSRADQRLRASFLCSARERGPAHEAEKYRQKAQKIGAAIGNA